MAQVQLYIAKTQGTHKGLWNINPSEEVARHIHDFGAALEILRYDASRASVVYLVSYIEEGLLLTLLRPVDGGSHNNYSATLFFAHGMNITGEQFDGIVGAVRNAIMPGTDPDADTITELRRLLTTDYDTEKHTAYFAPSTGASYAYAYYGAPAPTWDDYVSHSFYQPEYPKYAGVVLVDTLSGIKGREGSRNLTAPLTEMCVVYPPKPTREGFMPYLGHTAFRRPVLAAKGTSMDILWRRSGFETIGQRVDVDSCADRTPSADTSAARKVVTPGSFYVSEQGSRRPISAYRATVNGRPIEGPTPFAYRELTDAQVEIAADGYEPFSAHLDLAATAQPLVQLRRMDNAYFFELPIVADVPCEPVRFCVTSKKALRRCPFEGYGTASGTLSEGPDKPNTLIYMGGIGRRLKIIFAASVAGALLMGIIIGCLFGSGKKSEKPKQEEAVEVVQVPVAKPDTVEVVEVAAEPEIVAEPEAAAEAAPAPAPDAKAAAAYLDANKNWRRGEMEAIPGLEGFFDDLNQYNFDRIKEYWAPLLGESRNFKAVLHAVEGSSTKRSPRKVPHSPNYNSDGDEVINWLKYTYWVDP